MHAEPNSGVYELLQRGELSHTHSAIAANKLFQPIRHRFALQSAYEQVTAEEPPFTTFTPGLVATEDYVWYTATHLSAVGVLQVAERADIERDTALPSPACASDHQLLFVVLERTE